MWKLTFGSFRYSCSFARCISKPASTTSPNDEACLMRCTDRYLEAFNLISQSEYSILFPPSLPSPPPGWRAELTNPRCCRVRTTGAEGARGSTSRSSPTLDYFPPIPLSPLKCRNALPSPPIRIRNRTYSPLQRT